MGLFDNLKEKFLGQKNVQPNVPPIQREDPYEKAKLCRRIIRLRDSIKSIEQNDSSIWNLAYATEETLERRSVAELTKTEESLNVRLSQLQRRGQRPNSGMEAVEAAKWTGRPAPGQSMNDLDRAQRYDDGR